MINYLSIVSMHQYSSQPEQYYCPTVMLMLIILVYVLVYRFSYQVHLHSELAGVAL